MLHRGEEKRVVVVGGVVLPALKGSLLLPLARLLRGVPVTKNRHIIGPN